jgi:glucose-1-phosphate thymidylyltransferase
MLDMHLAYLMLGLPHGPPYTLDQAYPFVRDATVVFGFPDILCEPQDGFVRLLDRQRETDADVVLGVFQAEDASGVDVCDLDEHGWVREVLPKPRPTQLRDAWLTAVWTPVFTEFMHDHLAAVQRESREPERELSVGHVLQAGVQAGLRVSSVRFADGVFIDIGTPDDLVRAVQMYAR